MLPLLLSLLPLALGPLLVAWARRSRGSAVWLDAFVIVTVGGMVLLHILPESLGRGGWWALGAFVIGLLAPVLAEQGLAPTGKGTRAVALVLALVALLFHSMIDGVWLTDHSGHDHAGHDHGATNLLSWAVLLHRLLEGLGIWWVVPRTLGVPMAVLTSVVLGVGTILGYSLGDDLLAHAPATGIAVLEALLCGSLAHVVVHAHIPPPRDGERRASPASGGEGRTWNVASLLGGIAGAVVTWVLTANHSHDHTPTTGAAADGHAHGPGAIFLDLALQSAPALVFGYLAVGLSQSFLPADWAGRIMRGSPLSQALRGVAVGLPLPVCSCGVLPIYRDLTRKGASLAGGIAFLVATPELEIAAILMSFSLLGPEVAVARVAAAGVLALLTALIVHRVGRARAVAEPKSEPAPAAPPRSIGAALRYGFVDAVADTGSWLLAGLGLAAILTPYLDPNMVKALPAGIDVPAAALLGLPIYVCASGSTPLAAVMVAQGISPGAAIAFLLTGPATNLTTYGVLANMHGRRVAATFAICMLVLATLLGYAVNAALPTLAPAAATADHHHSGTPLQFACLAILALALLFYLLRVGVRGMLARLFLAHDGGHAHGPHDGHDHDHAGHDHDHGPPPLVVAAPSCCSHKH